MATQLDPSQISQAISPNIIDNGGMEIWQRGILFNNPIGGAYTADRWQINNNGNTATFAVSKDTAITDGSPSSLRWALSNVGTTTVFRLRTSVEGAQYAGKTVTVKARVRVDSGGGGFCFIDINDVNGITPFTANNATTLSNGTWETITVSRTLGSNVTQVNVQFNFNNTPGTAYIDNVMMVVGSTPMDYIPLNPQVELARCQRFYFRMQAEAVATGQAVTSSLVTGVIRYPVPMRTAPTLSVTGTANITCADTGGGAHACSAIVINAFSTNQAAQYSFTTSAMAAGSASGIYIQNSSGILEFSADF